MIPTKPKILCVDDEPAILKTFEILLVPNGYEVIKAQNGQEALEKLKEERIDLVLMDVMMPKLDGLEACRRIKGDERTRNIPVVLITALSAKGDRIKGIEAGAEDFISKPFDAAEVLARVKMLLKSKSLSERRIGELLIEMGFITEEKLQEALIISREQKIKVGEALNSMGALDKDHIYWVLSTQLKMNYIELSPEMIDKDLVKQFSIDTLEQLLCLPLYENMGEIHFAIADPTNYKIVKEIKSLKPFKSVQLHLALPEKIADILSSLKGEFSPTAQPSKKIPTGEKCFPPSFSETETLPDSPNIEFYWDHFVTFLFSLSRGQIGWLYKDPQICRLISQEGIVYKTIHHYSEEIYLFIKEQLKQNISAPDGKKETRLFLRQKSTQQQGVFKLWQVDGLDRSMTRIVRIPEFSPEEFFMEHPQAPGLIEDLRRLFAENGRLLLGGGEKLFIKQCFSSMIDAKDFLPGIPPAFLIEGEVEMYFPKVAQLGNDEMDLIHFLDRFPRSSTPWIFYEPNSQKILNDEKTLSKIFSAVDTNILLYFPFSSLEEMHAAFGKRKDWLQAGFKAVFYQPYQLTFI